MAGRRRTTAPIDRGFRQSSSSGRRGAHGTGIYPQWPLDVTIAGFEQIETYTFDAELAALLAARFPTDPLTIPHRVFTLTCCTPGV